MYLNLKNQHKRLEVLLLLVLYRCHLRNYLDSFLAFITTSVYFNIANMKEFQIFAVRWPYLETMHG